MKKLSIIAASLLAAAGAQAATLSFMNPLQTTEISQSGSLSLFDSSQGTLTGVTLTFTGANTTVLTLTNNAAQSQTTRATATTDLFFGSSLGALDTLINSANPVVSLSATTGFVTLASGSSQSFGPLDDSESITWNSQPAGQLSSILGAFVGAGEFAITCTSISGIAIQGGGGNIASNQATQAQCGASIEYAFVPTSTEVPEPGALALVGIALAGLALSRRRKA